MIEKESVGSNDVQDKFVNLQSEVISASSASWSKAPSSSNSLFGLVNPGDGEFFFSVVLGK